MYYFLYKKPFEGSREIQSESLDSLKKAKARCERKKYKVSYIYDSDIQHQPVDAPDDHPVYLLRGLQEELSLISFIAQDRVPSDDSYEITEMFYLLQGWIDGIVKSVPRTF